VSPNDRLRNAREARGLSEDAVAQAAALPVSWYRDLELFEDELTDNVSLARLQIIGGILSVSPAELFGYSPVAPDERVYFEDLSAGLRLYCERSGLNIVQASERIGWDLSNAVIDSSEFWNFNVCGLQDVCSALAIDWVKALPDAA
jgi:transcriptional regulator with XRE-family HTH domain